MRDTLQRLMDTSRVASGLFVGLLMALCLVLAGFGVLVGAVIALIVMVIARQPARSIGLTLQGAPRALALGTLAGIAIYLLATFAIEPLAEAATGTRHDYSAFDGMEGNTAMFLIWLAMGIVVGGVIEEFLFRGIFVTYGDRAFGSGLATGLVGAMLFGLAHLYQGMAGVISTGTIGALLVFLYVGCGRRLLVPMMAHAVNNTIALTLAYTGLRGLNG